MISLTRLSTTALALATLSLPLAAFAEDATPSTGSGSAPHIDTSHIPAGLLAKIRGEIGSSTEHRPLQFTNGERPAGIGQFSGTSTRPSLEKGDRGQRPEGELGLFGSSTVRQERRDERQASTTARIEMRKEDRMASTTARHEEKLMGVGSAEIDARIAKLTEALGRINSLEKLTADAKASLIATLTDQITKLTALKAQIAAGTSTTTLKTDVQSITKDFRVYALVLPKAAITAAADRVVTIADQMTGLSAKFSERITAAQTAGADVSAAQTALADFTAKVADAKTQAQAAATAVANLTPDNGDKTKLEANTAALKAAQAQIKTAQDELKAARADIDTILKTIKGKGETKDAGTSQ